MYLLNDKHVLEAIAALQTKARAVTVQTVGDQMIAGGVLWWVQIGPLQQQMRDMRVRGVIVFDRNAPGWRRA